MSKMRQYNLNFEQSKAVYERCKQYIKVNHCYNNIFEVVTDYMSNFRSGKWKIAYGYTGTIPLVYCRHCFILDENEEVIDPTIFAQPDQSDREYFVMATFEDVDEYITAIENEGCYPALNKYLREQDIQAFKWAKENSIILIP